MAALGGRNVRQPTELELAAEALRLATERVQNALAVAEQLRAEEAAAEAAGATLPEGNTLRGLGDRVYTLEHMAIEAREQLSVAGGVLERLEQRVWELEQGSASVRLTPVEDVAELLSVAETYEDPVVALDAAVGEYVRSLGASSLQVREVLLALVSVVADFLIAPDKRDENELDED